MQLGTLSSVGSFFLALALSPLLLGVINRTKALFAGRVGQPLLQAYHDWWKLMKKGAVYSETTSWVFRWTPIVSVAATVAALALVPSMGSPALVGFSGDFLFAIGLLALARFSLVLSALDTGSSFEGLGASRDILFSALVEPALLLAFVALARRANADSLALMMSGSSTARWVASLPSTMLIMVALFVLLLAENARIPVDDPATHLELTMIHEVMILDNSGPDLALLHYASAIKLWLFSSLIVSVALPDVGPRMGMKAILFLLGMVGIAIAVGVVESVMGRLRLSRVPTLLMGAAACALFAFLLVLEGRP